MLVDIAPLLTKSKHNEFVSRLLNRDTTTALATEAELAVTWAVSRVATVEIEPAVVGSNRRPEMASRDLFSSAKCLVEVRALSDDSFSGQLPMERTANIVTNFTDRLRAGSSTHIHFSFNERQYWKNGFKRERCVDPNFELTHSMKSQLVEWLRPSNEPSAQTIRISDQRTDVVLSWKPSVSASSRIFCTMPAVVYDLEDNPVYKALKAKSSQLMTSEEGVLKCVVLFDVGCKMLRRMRPFSPVFEIGTADVIRHAMKKLSVDVVVVMSAQRPDLAFHQSSRKAEWVVKIFDRRSAQPESEYFRLNQAINLMPPAKLEGYQARHLHSQGSFARTNVLSVGTTISTHPREEGMTIKFSAALLHEYLAGRIDGEKFRIRAFSDTNYFELERSRGNSIRDVRFEAGGVDKDDDFIVIELGPDPAKIIETR